MARRPELRRELRHRHGARMTARDGMVFAEDHEDGVAVQVDAVDALQAGMWLVRPFVRQHEVDVPEREHRQRLLGLGLDELAVQAGRVSSELLQRRCRDAKGDGLEGRDPTPPGHASHGGREIGLGELGAVEQHACVTDEHERGVRQPHAAPRPLQELNPGLALEHRELLRDGGRRVLQRLRHRRDRAALVELVQQPQPAEVEHQAMLLNTGNESQSILDLARGRIRLVRSTGIVLCLASAISFGAMGIFGKLAYDEGASVGTLLSIRFSLAAILFWVLLIRSGAIAGIRHASRRDIATAVGLGAVGYSAQTGCYFSALDRLDASLLALLVYTFPAIVTVAAVVLGRERASRRASASLVLASGGLVLVLAGAGSGTLDPLGVTLGFAAAVVYSAYILTSEGVAARLGPLALSTLVCTGAAPMLTVASAAGGDLDPRAVSAMGIGWIACIAVVSTVAAISLFFAGLRLVGATTASIVSTAEPLTTVVLAYIVFGESLGPVQLLGGALVLLGVLVLSARTAPPKRPARRYRLEPTLDD